MALESVRVTWPGVRGQAPDAPRSHTALACSGDVAGRRETAQPFGLGGQMLDRAAQ